MNARTVSAAVAVLALVQIALGVGLIFAPAEAARLLFPEPGVPPVLLSLVGAALLGFGQVNWLTRRMPIGGIYGRPVVLANLSHFVIGGLALLRAADALLWVLCAFYLAGAIFYGMLLFTSPEARDVTA